MFPPLGYFLNSAAANIHVQVLGCFGHVSLASWFSLPGLPDVARVKSCLSAVGVLIAHEVAPMLRKRLISRVLQAA